MPILPREWVLSFKGPLFLFSLLLDPNSPGPLKPAFWSKGMQFLLSDPCGGSENMVG